MSESVFREKSLKRISSPEELNHCINTAGVPTWIILIVITLLILAGLAWGIFGYVDSFVDAVAVSDGSETVVYIGEDKIDSIESGQTVKIDGEEYTLGEVNFSPVLASQVMSEYAYHVGDFMDGEFVYVIPLEATAPEGTFEASIVTERVNAITFLWN